MNGSNRRVEVAEERIHEFDDTIDIIQSEQQRKNRLKKLVESRRPMGL